MEPDEPASAELLLYGYCGDDWEGGGFTAQGVVRALSGLGDVVVRINSGGGSAFEGAAIYAVLKAHPGKVAVRVEGIAASAASLIAMAGETILMAGGAMMMIHDPSGITIGPAADHQKTAEDLDKIAANYADVYAARSGQTAARARELMLAETWMTAAEAVALGFADSAAEGEASKLAAAFDYTVYARAPEMLRAMAFERGWQRRQSATRASAPSQEEVRMEANEMTAPSEAAKTTPAAQKAAEPTAADKAAGARELAENQRRKAVVARFGDKLTATQADAIAAEARDEADALMKAADIVIEAKMAGAGPEFRPTAHVTSDEGERKVEAMIGALSHSLFGAKLEGPATQFRGLTAKALALDLSGKKGYGYTEAERIKAGMAARGVLMAGASHSTSDFTYLTAETMNRALRAAYAARPGTWGRISRQRTASDFRALYSVQAGVETELREVGEDGEYQSTVLNDTGETFKVKRYGRKVLLTFEAVINDDLGAFARIPGDFARGATNLESAIVWGLINANGNMSDGVAIFATSAARRNLAASAAALDATAVGLGRKAMWEQRPLGAKATGGDFISAVPNLLYVPPAQEVKALQFAAATVPVTDGTTNPFKGTLEVVVEPRLGAAVAGGSDTAWYMFDSSLPTVEHAFLQGYEAPMIEAEDRLDPRGVTMFAEHIFGAGVVEFRGAFKNAGA